MFNTKCTHGQQAEGLSKARLFEILDTLESGSRPLMDKVETQRGKIYTHPCTRTLHKTA